MTTKHRRVECWLQVPNMAARGCTHGVGVRVENDGATVKGSPACQGTHVTVCFREPLRLTSSDEAVGAGGVPGVSGAVT